MITETQRKAAEALAALGWTQADIAHALGYANGSSISHIGIKRRRGIDERVPAMVESFKAGKTLGEIGVEHGISRERVRQLLAKVGIQGRDGGAHKRAESHSVEVERYRIARRNARTKNMLGCEWDEAVSLNGGSATFRTPGTRAYSFLQQKRTALVRNIAWDMTFPEWCRVWDDSGRWDERGRGKHGYCMSRIRDAGSYAIGNVRIASNLENIREGYEVTPALQRFAEAIKRREQLQIRCRELRKQGVSHKEIGRILGISAATSTQYACAAKDLSV